MQLLTLSETEWRRRLSPAQYSALREARTEPAFAGRYTHNTAAGRYRCAGCQLDLFDSADKLDTDSGWASFAQAIAPDRIRDHCGTGHGQTRTETRCARCDGHIGHAYSDGPAPAGQRYCLNSISLDFRPREAIAGTTATG